MSRLRIVGESGGLIFRVPPPPTTYLTHRFLKIFLTLLHLALVSLTIPREVTNTMHTPFSVAV